METSPLPTKGCKFLPFLGIHGHWAMRVLKRATPTMTRDIRLYWSSLRTRDTHPCYRAFSYSSGAVTTCFHDLNLSQLGFKNHTFRLQFQRPYPLRQRRGLIAFGEYCRLLSSMSNYFYDCLFAWGFSSRSRIFHSYGGVTITGEVLQILTYAWHLWSMSREDFLACHTECYTGHPCDTHTYWQAFGSSWCRAFV